MKKITSKPLLVLYACSGLGVNMLNLIVGSYLCSALIPDGFDKNVEHWTYLNKELVVAELWIVLSVIAKIVDGLIDLPFSHFADNLKTRWGRRRPALLMGYVPMVLAYLLFLVPLQSNATVLNTVWFAFCLCVFYGAYTLTMLTYYATFAEITGSAKDIDLLSNIKSVCDVVYFSLSFVLVPLFVGMGINIRNVAVIFLPLSLTMMIPMFLLKEKPLAGKHATALEEANTSDRVTLFRSISFTFQDKAYIGWLCILFVMNMGLQLFLSGINEYFSTLGLNMPFIMPACFAPVPFTILLYNKILRTKGMGFAYRYVLIVFSAAMTLMSFCKLIPSSIQTVYAILCGVMVSFSIGAFFAVTYSIPSHRAALRKAENTAASSMYFAIQGLFEAASAGLGGSAILVLLKKTGGVKFTTAVVAALCMAAFGLSFLLPKGITQIGLTGESRKK